MDRSVRLTAEMWVKSTTLPWQVKGSDDPQLDGEAGGQRPVCTRQNHWKRCFFPQDAIIESEAYYRSSEPQKKR